MARRHSRRHHKGSRKAHRKGSRKSHRKSHRRQRGGGSCAAMPLNREAFQQRGGMAPFSTGDATLLDKATMVQAQSWQQVADIDAAQGLARASQHGGSRRRRSRRHRKHRRSHRSRTAQRGGNYPWAVGLPSFNGPSTLAPAGVPTGVNPQFVTEGSVIATYSPTRGAQ